MRVRGSLVVLGLLLGLVPTAHAHGEPFSQIASIRIGPYDASIDPQPVPIFAETKETVTVLITDPENGNLIEPSKVNVRFTDPAGFDANISFRNAGDPNSPYFTGDVAFPRPGNVSATLTIVVAGATYGAPASFQSYTNYPFRIYDVGATADAVVHRPYTMTYAVLDAKTRSPYLNLTDLRLRMEHWTDDHKTLLGVNESQLRHTANARWTVTETFSHAGMYHLGFSSVSGGFNHTQFPMLHLWASEPTAATSAPPTSQAPAPTAALLLAIVAAVIVVRRAARR